MEFLSRSSGSLHVEARSAIQKIHREEKLHRGSAVAGQIITAFDLSVIKAL